MDWHHWFDYRCLCYMGTIIKTKRGYKEMNKLKVLVLLLLVVVVTAGCSRVPPGHVGVKVYLLGGEKGVDTEDLGGGPLLDRYK